MSSSNLKTLVALINAMIGSAMLVLPLMSLEAGILTTIVLVLVCGMYSLYSCKLVFQHTNQHQNTFGEAINRHYRRPVFPLYDIFSFLSDELILYNYFSIIILQWQGLFYKIPAIIPALPYLTMVSLLGLTLYLSKRNMSLGLMAYGIISIMFYTFFVTWMFATKPQQARNEFPVWTWNIPKLAGLLTLAISVQTVFMPILKRNADKSKIQLLLFLAIILGMLLYIYFGIVGGYGLKDRVPAYQGAETVMQYFVANQWEPVVLELIYLLHLYTVWPERVAINKKRLLNILHVEDTELNSNTYICLSIMLACLLNVAKVTIQSFIEINGGVCLFFVIYAIPIWLHVKCTYLYNTIWGIEEAAVQLPDHQPSGSNLDSQCTKTRESRSKILRVTEAIFLISMLLFGMAILVYTLDRYVIEKIIGR